ncbi:hypothetical protein FSW04_15320 [Baekduia soli]|uniref:Uncharacterized protein n=1 Tax=Baekduia soli TaxID=496014 RepID=A0A5B8U789_9ACTN|nr:hypothetical protein [Baekduia soli]QEC48811.1 hypothetical protein FSW04_15320 [Baekduia soli]
MSNSVQHERRPTGPYYEVRTPLLSQGDIFDDVPLGYPSPALEIAVEEVDESARAFLSGPLSFGPAMLITPTCSLRSQTAGRDYAHPVRTLVPLRPVQELMEAGILDPSKRGLAERRDSLINYMWMPPLPDVGLEESMALLYMPATLHHDMIADRRVSQLTRDASSQLQKKLAWYSTSMLLERSDFDPPMD